jgi:25S rRNA (cytosine2870-C5)-methyltransferase
MKKQGPPEPLSEAHYANLKRKKGLPVDDTPVEVHSNKKRRTSAKPEKPTKRRREEPAKDAVASKPANGTKKASRASDNGVKVVKGKSKKAAVPEPDSDEEMDDEFDVSDLKDAGDSDLEEPTLGDDFLDSGDDSVYDSDQDNAKKEKFVFSDDEDDDDEDREEKLTAANIEGLSRKLDEKLAREAEENEAELREAALQTNIDGDKPNVLGDEDEEDELSSKTQGLLAPDLQMLRTRITETIRVLEDFSNLAEEGRSRAEYTNQLLKDVCACKSWLSMVWLPHQGSRTDSRMTDYGYNEFLAEKLMYVAKPQAVPTCSSGAEALVWCQTGC